MGQCDAPCQGFISKEEYGKNIEQVIQFLSGNYNPVVKMLEDRMHEAAAKMEYEKAATMRDLLGSVRQIMNKQKITYTDQADRDIIAFARNKDEAVVQTFFIRGGKLIGRDHFYLTGVEDESDSGVITSFIKQFYAGTPYIPKEIFLETEPEESDILSRWLSEKGTESIYKGT